MNKNFYALCTELVDIIRAHANPDDYAVGDVAEVLARFDAALADGPAVPEGREPVAVTGQPSDEELLRIYGLAKRNHNYEGPIYDWHKRAERAATVAGLRAVLARWGTPAPAPPADGGVAELAAALQSQAIQCTCDQLTSGDLRRAAELLQRQALVPVAVPGEEYHDDMGAVTWWRLPVDEPPWIGTPNDSDWPGYHTHFTPAPPVPANANALPLPEVDQ